MTPSELTKRIRNLRHRTERDLDDLLADIRTENVKPYCDKHRMRFSGGAGTWVFFPEIDAKHAIGGWNEECLPKRLLAVLNEDYMLNPGQSMGSMTPDYTPPNWKGKK